MESFLAPEIFEGIAPNISTDIYALGCVLYFMTYYDPKKYEVCFWYFTLNLLVNKWRKGFLYSYG